MPNQQIPVPQSRCISEYRPMMSGGGHSLTERIEEGSFYELDRSKLPPGTPYLLRHSIRVVMVTAKNDMNVTVRYPSSKSLEAYIVNPNGYPAMDEKFIMGPQLAAETLARKIPYLFSMNRSDAFWFDQTSKHDRVESKFGTCLSRLRESGNGWGEYRLVSYVGNVEKDSCARQSSSHSSLAYVPKIEIQEEVERSTDIIKFEAEDMMEEKEDEDAAEILKSKKRKRKASLKREKDIHNKDGDNLRWKLPRYERAKNELLAVMKAKEASCQNPIPRKELREAARKHIGDTGLLDHLLLHVVDKLAPGGTERFRRRCDPQGLTEYWLESADMMDIRKKAGVLDPYWLPPSGWKLGDPTCNCRSNSTDVIPKEMYDALLRREPELMEKYDELLKEKARMEQELMEISKSLKKH